MPESDEEYDRRNRDKFVRERDYPSRGMTGDRYRRDYSNGLSNKRSSGRRDDEPAGKRGRFETAADSYEPEFIRKDDTSGPVLLTFKKFCTTIEDSVSDEEAKARYIEYKKDFKRKQIQKFFDAHKDEEWFKLKYHPDLAKKPKEEQQAFLQKRLDIFNELLDRGVIGNVKLNYDSALELIHLLDTVAIKLEKGTDEDIQAMLEEPVDDESVLELKKANNSTTEPTKSEEPALVKSQPETNGTNGEAKPTDVQLNEQQPTEVNTNTESQESNAEEGELSSMLNRKRSHPHKTCSIFFRNIPPALTFEEIEAACKQHPGFLRLCLSDPIPDQKFSRRGWVSFRRDVNIKEIFWALKSVKVSDHDLGATVNRDLKRRVRTVNGITLHKTVAQNDLRQAAKLVALHDYRAGFYFDESTQGPITNLELTIMQSHNPILKGITEYLVEETSAEEDELLGRGREPEEDVQHPFERDDELLKVLDKLILYLRIVYSIDFYNHGEYLYEDYMPNRLGMIHVRGPPPNGSSNESGVPLVTQKAINDHIDNFNEQLESHLLRNNYLSEEGLAALGKKDPDKEVEKFVEENCVQLAPDKWLCPLSGKKFKGPEFIQKHLTSKHQDKLDEVHEKAVYFNNYVSDPERPHDPEPKQPQTTATTNPGGDEARRNDMDRAPRSFGTTWNDRMNQNRFSGGNRMGGGRDFGRGRYFDSLDSGVRVDRRQTSYKDLDAPEEIA